MYKAACTLILLSLCAAIPALGGEDAGAPAPKSRSNHYILLIDASGSVVKPELKKRAFERALFERLLQELYRDGFGGAIPPYDPAEDQLSVCHFGVVVGEREDAYARMAGYDFSTQFIHAFLTRGRHVTSEELRQTLFPEQTYQYTILSWAKELALNQLQPRGEDTLSRRTFLIVVHDGVPNENSLAEEVAMVQRWARPEYDKVSPIVASIDREYGFTDGEGNRKPAWSEQVSEPGAVPSAPIFIEAYEVAPVAQLGQRAEAQRLRPELRVEWVRESGEAPEGRLTAVPGETLDSWARAAKSADVSLSLERGGQVMTGQGLEMPFVERGPLSCAPRDFKAALNVSLRQPDRLLGDRLVTYSYPMTVTAPAPASCAASFVIKWVGAALLAALLVGALVYYLRYRFFATQLEILVPGTIVPIRLGRQGEIEAIVHAVPQQGVLALTLKLPSLLKQYLFHHGATITLVPRDGQSLYWAGTEAGRELRLPLDRDCVPAYWRTTAREPSTVTLNYQQGSQHTGISLSYPSSASEPVEGARI